MGSNSTLKYCENCVNITFLSAFSSFSGSPGSSLFPIGVHCFITSLPKMASLLLLYTLISVWDTSRSPFPRLSMRLLIADDVNGFKQAFESGSGLCSAIGAGCFDLLGVEGVGSCTKGWVVGGTGMPDGNGGGRNGLLLDGGVNDTGEKFDDKRITHCVSNRLLNMCKLL